MVFIKSDNIYQLRDYLFAKVAESAYNDPFKSSLLLYLDLSKNNFCSFCLSHLSLYQKCSISGVNTLEEEISKQDILRLLGQAAKIDSTPQPWMSDVLGVVAVKWLVDRLNDNEISNKFKSWTSYFLEQQINGGNFHVLEKDLAIYIRDENEAHYKSATIPLFLHYLQKQCINDHKIRLSLIENFFCEFNKQTQEQCSTSLLILMLYVFDKISHEQSIISPKGWALEDLLAFLERIPIGLKRWTWEEIPRTKKSTPVKWYVENEYHVQNLLYVILGPIFNDIVDEIYLEPIGQKTPRVDLYLPSLHTIIEVKYRKDNKKSFSALIGEIAEDISLYRSDPKYSDSQIISFLWDCTRSTQEHTKFKEGILKIIGVNGCVVLSAPSQIQYS